MLVVVWPLKLVYIIPPVYCIASRNNTLVTHFTSCFDSPINMINHFLPLCTSLCPFNGFYMQTQFVCYCFFPSQEMCKVVGTLPTNQWSLSQHHYWLVLQKVILHSLYNPGSLNKVIQLSIICFLFLTTRKRLSPVSWRNHLALIVWLFLTWSKEKRHHSD